MSEARRLRATDELMRILPPALHAAVLAGAGAAGIEQPFVVEVRMRPDGRPFARVGAERFRARMVETSAEDGAAVDVLYRAEPPDGAMIELTDWLDDDAKEAVGEIQATLARNDLSDPDMERCRAVLTTLGRELAASLNRDPWPGATDEFLALVHIGDPYGDDVDPYGLATLTAGSARVDAFRETVRSRRTTTAGPPASARHDRAALAAAMAERGLAQHADRLAALAEVGFKLEPAPDREPPGSRLGGPALLPADEPWPHDAEGRPLSFLAAIDLSELPDAEPLPAGGWLLFFADLDNDDGEGFVDVADNVPGSKVRLFHLPAGQEPVPARAPETLVVALEHRPVRAHAQLTLPDGWDAAEQLGLDVGEGEAQHEVALWLNRRDDTAGDHWVLGALTGVQGEQPPPGSLLLLQMGWDEPLGFEFLDGGEIQFRIPAAALAAGDWSAVTATAGSC